MIWKLQIIERLIKGVVKETFVCLGDLHNLLEICMISNLLINESKAGRVRENWYLANTNLL